MSKFKSIRIYRRTFLVFSILLGIFSPLFFLHKFPDFNPLVEPISTFGVKESTFLFWKFVIIVLSIAIVLNALKAINFHFKLRRVRLFLKSILGFSSISLMLVAFISMNFNETLHHLSAFLFFMTYNFFVFIFGFIRMYRDLRKGFLSVIIGSMMLLSTILLIPYESYGVFEIVYVSLVLIWNIIIFTKRVIKIG